MAWIQAHQHLRDHRKLLAAADELEIEPVHLLGHLISFWLWALDNAPSGSLAEVNNRTIARAAQWNDEPNKLVDALTSTQWLDIQEDGNLMIHDWYDYAGKLIEQRESERERARQRRAAASKNQKLTAGRTTDVRKTSNGRTADSRQTSEEHTTDVRQTSDGRVDKSIVDKSIVDSKDNNPPYPPSEKEPDEQERRFAEFWKLYPKKIAKRSTRFAWKRINPDNELFEQIMRAVKEAKSSDQWKREEGRYIPNPTTWLNQARWEDELICGETVAASKTEKPDTLGVLRGIIAGVEEEGGEQS